MPLTIEPLDERNLPLFLAHLRDGRAAGWTESQLDDFVAWRYFGRQDWETTLAVAKDSCVATIDCLIRPYVAAGVTVQAQETSEWFCHPRYRPIGLGVRLLQTRMKRAEPIVAVRGTLDTQKLLPRLGWRRLPDVALLSTMLNWRSRMRNAAGAVTGRGVNRRPGAVALESIEAAPTAADLTAVAQSSTSALVALLRAWEVDWYSSAPQPAGQFVWRRFVSEGAYIGYALCRVYEGDAYRRGQIVHLASTVASPAVMAQMIDAAVAALRAHGAVRIVARTSSPAVAGSYVANGFSADAPQPAYWWSNEPDDMPGGETHLSYLRGDDSFRPMSAMSVG